MSNLCDHWREPDNSMLFSYKIQKHTKYQCGEYIKKRLKTKTQSIHVLYNYFFSEICAGLQRGFRVVWQGCLQWAAIILLETLCICTVQRSKRTIFPADTFFKMAQYAPLVVVILVLWDVWKSLQRSSLEKQGAQEMGRALEEITAGSGEHQHSALHSRWKTALD